MADSEEDGAGWVLSLGDTNPEMCGATFGQSLSVNLLLKGKCGRPPTSITPSSADLGFSF